MSTKDDKKSLLESRNVTIGNKRTSMRLEPQMWGALERIAGSERVTINKLCTRIERRRREIGLTAATRMFILSYYRCLVWRYERQWDGKGQGLAERAPSLKGAHRADWVLEIVDTHMLEAGTAHDETADDGMHRRRSG